MTRISGTLHEDQYKFLIISHSVRLRKRYVSEKSCSGNLNTHFVLNNYLLKIMLFMRYCAKI